MDIIQKGKRVRVERIRESGGVTEQVKRGFAKEYPRLHCIGHRTWSLHPRPVSALIPS